MRIALRTQQIIAQETGVTNTIDPLGGSYYVEALTDELERRAYAYFARIDELGGMVDAVKQNFPQREIADASFALQQEIDAGRRQVVGVNAQPQRRRRRAPDRCASTRRSSTSRSTACRPSARRRDGAAVERELARLREAAAREDENLMPHLLDAARVHATEGEIVLALQDVFGSYSETPVF